MTPRTFFLSALLLLFLSLTFSSAHAQFRVSIQGVDTDQQRAVVQDGTVNLTKATIGVFTLSTIWLRVITR